MTDLASVRLSVTSRSEVDLARLDRAWNVTAACFAPATVLGADESRWRETLVVTATSGDRVIGLLPLERWRCEEFVSRRHDPVAVAPAVFGDTARGADEYLFVGTASEFVAGAAWSTDLPHASAAELRKALVNEAFAEATRLGLVPAALYVRDSDTAAFSAGNRAAAIETFCSIELSDEDDQGYLASLNHSHRSVVLRDWRRLASQSLRCDVVAADTVTDEAAPLVAGVKIRNGLHDNAIAAGRRLRRWSAEPFGDRVAFVVRGADGDLLSVCFGCHHGSVLELYEIGLAAADPEVRHLAYVESMVYMPRRFAVEAGCRRLDLGLGSLTPKLLRGAEPATVWAIGATSGGLR